MKVNRKKEALLSQGKLKELFNYDELNGEFTWKISKKYSKRKAGSIAGWITKSGYIQIEIDGVAYLVHRLIFLYVYGKWPTDQIDHVDGARNNNRLVNLREVTRSENQRNRTINKNNTSGITGVYWTKNTNNWFAAIGLNGKLKHLGYFTNKEDAIVARKAAEIKYEYHQGHGKPIQGH